MNKQTKLKIRKLKDYIQKIEEKHQKERNGKENTTWIGTEKTKNSGKNILTGQNAINSKIQKKSMRKEDGTGKNLNKKKVNMKTDFGRHS